MLRGGGNSRVRASESDHRPHPRFHSSVTTPHTTHTLLANLSFSSSFPFTKATASPLCLTEDGGARGGGDSDGGGSSGGDAGRWGGGIGEWVNELGTARPIPVPALSATQRHFHRLIQLKDIVNNKLMT